MPDYSKGKTHKILNDIDDGIYVGSTIETLGKIMSQHRSDMKINSHRILYQHMHKLSVDNFYIELIENYPCNDIYEFGAIENHIIREIGTLNEVIIGGTKHEWKEQHTEYTQDYNKHY